MKYEVIRYFTDAADNEHLYHEGDIYPRDGFKPSLQHIQRLLSGNNFQRIPLIKMITSDKKAVKKAKVEEPMVEAEVVETPVETEVAWTSEEIDRMPFMKLKSVAKKNDVSVDGKKADEIRSDLKEKLGL